MNRHRRSLTASNAKDNSLPVHEEEEKEKRDESHAHTHVRLCLRTDDQTVR